MTNQPEWKLKVNLGDVNFLDYGGFFVFEDETGVYPAEAEYLDVDWNDDNPIYTIYRFGLDRCTFENGILSDNPYHPEHPAWFAKPEPEKANRPQDMTYLSNVADCSGMSLDELRQQFCSEDLVERAFAYREIGLYHGFDNLDSYPLVYHNREEVEERYKTIREVLP